MISILICSVNKFYLDQVTINIKKTIGIEYEILFYDNRIEKKGICEVYNYLGKKAKYPILLFLHEDTLFTTDSWGGNILDVFKDDTEIGVIGLAGSKYKSRVLSGWYTGLDFLDYANVTHKLPNREEKLKIGFKGNLIEEVVCIDGVFMCCKKNIFSTLFFDEKNIKGFHFYDLDFSLRASLFCKIVVIFNINLIHITNGGDFGDKWLVEAISFHKNRNYELPNKKLLKNSSNFEFLISKTWLDFLKNHKIILKNRLKWINTQKFYLNPFLYYSIIKFCVYKLLGIKKIHKLFK